MYLKRCRLCGGRLPSQAGLRYAGMPSAAQYLPGDVASAQRRRVILKVCQCSACGLVQLRNRPVPYYREVIRAGGISPAMRTILGVVFAGGPARLKE